jgi:hypothetical protein
MIRTTLYATAAAAVGLAIAGGAYAASAGERPTQITPVVQSDDNGGRTDRDQRVEPGDDRRPNGSATPSRSATPTGSAMPSRSAMPSPSASARGRHQEAGDDNGGRTDRDQRVEPGDDRRPNGERGRGTDDRGRGTDDRGSDDRGRGTDDRGRDDRGTNG